ncbi:lipoprotein [Spiroplasma endosymbiont of Dioctria linearis]|uniref:lipoprotein n=1 Tax=Spiroplasma endosymbiont of Dioctria linearis TaxID=3066290 RepID=UPI00313C4B27
MKKLLSLLSAIGLISTPSLSVMACGNKVAPPVLELETLIKEFKNDVNKILNEHIADTNKNFLIIDKPGSNLKFFNKQKFEDFMGSDSNKIADDEVRPIIIEDFNNLFKLNELKQKINDLNKVEKYSVLLAGTSSVFKELVIVPNKQIEIKTKSYEEGNKRIWFGTTKFNYSVSVNFQNKTGEFEEYKIQDVPNVISITDDEEIGGNIQDMYNSVEEKFLLNDISRVYSTDLNLGSRTFLEQNNNEIMNYFNDSSYSNKFLKFVKDEFNIDLTISKQKSFTNLKNLLSYRENKLGEDELKRFLDNTESNDANIKSLISSTENISEEYMIDNLSSKLNQISLSLGNNENMNVFINSVIKFNSITLTNLNYKINDQEQIDIPNLSLSFGYFQNREVVSRKSSEFVNVLKDNFKVATNAFGDIYQTVKWSGAGYDQEHIIFSFSRNSQLFNKWSSLGIENKTQNINSFVNLEHSNLRTERDKLISNSKQSHFLFNVSWTADSKDGKYAYIINHSYNSGSAYTLFKDSYLGGYKLSVAFEMDYFKSSYTVNINKRTVLFSQGYSK